ncbi:MAG: glucokinase [Rhodospirillales bacterium]|nr:glucokinase [Rhodospirillales bacterium]
MPGLIADIGGTNVRFALVGEDDTVERVSVLQCADYPSLVGACEAYLGGLDAGSRPKRAALAVASPIKSDEVRMTNHPWVFSIDETRRQLGLAGLDVVNDFIAVALGLTRLSAADVRRVGGGEADPDAAIAVLGAGTGLGMAGLIRTHGGGRVPVSSEGGHVTLPAFDEREATVIAALRRTFGHVSAERVLSGPGLVNLYRAIGEVDGREIDPEMTPPECTARAMAGTCAISAEALRLFSVMLGTVAANLAVTFDARGGIYIAGGIVPKLGVHFAAENFRRRFEDKGRFRGYLETIPTAVIIHPLPAFIGLASLVSDR